jgi:hypothetical protein
MATPFDTIHNYALVVIRDYKIDKLYSLSVDDFKTFMDGFLLRSIPMFTNCQKDLNDYNLNTRQFNPTLDLTEQIILSNLEVITWMDSKILDVTQMQNQLNDTDFKMYSQAQNLKAKTDTREILREVVNQDMTNYGLKNIPWDSWAGGNFFGT